ncbi:MAG: cupredoxin domain-containing protein [Bacteroidota bacterium]
MRNELVLGVIAVMVLAFIGLSLTGVFSSTGNAAKNVDTGNHPVKEFTVQSYTETKDGKYFPTFSPKEMTVNKGDLVRIKITNIKGMHDFKIDEFGVYTETPLNQEMTVEFVVDKAGSFEYYCTQPGHRQNGHWGTLNVL